MLTLRYHHLLCLNLYQGLGYNDVFALQMNAVTQFLAAQPHTAVALNVGSDDLCRCCPYCVDGLCSQGNVDVIAMDEVIKNCLNLPECSSWNDIKIRLRRNLSLSVFDKCCSNCSWCRQNICSYRALCINLNS